MARHTANTKASFRDGIDKAKPLQPKNDDARVNKAKGAQQKKPLTPAQRQRILEKERDDLIASNANLSTAKEPMRAKRGAENKLLNGSCGAERTLLKKQTGVSNGIQHAPGSEQENTYSNPSPLPQVEQDPVDPWTSLPFSVNTLVNRTAWHSHAVGVTKDLIMAKAVQSVELEKLEFLLRVWKEDALSKTSDNDEANRLRAKELYYLLKPRERKLVHGGAVFRLEASDLEREELQKKKKMADLTHYSNDLERLSRKPDRKLTPYQVRKGRLLFICRLLTEWLQRSMLQDVATTESELKEYPAKARKLTKDYKAWCDANRLGMQLLTEESQKTAMSTANRAALKRQYAAREARQQERQAKRAKQKRRSLDSAPEPIAKDQHGTKDAEEDVIECKSTSAEPEHNSHHDVVGDVEKIVVEEASRLEEKPSQPEIPEESTSDENGADELPKAAPTLPATSEQTACDGTQSEGKQSSKKRSAASADLDDEQLAQDIQENKKPKISVDDQEDQQEASQQTHSDAATPPPMRNVRKITFAEYSQRHNLKAVSALKRPICEEAQKKAEQRAKDLWEQMTPEEQEGERQNQERLQDEAKLFHLTGDARSEHIAKMSDKWRKLYRQPAREPGLVVKGVKNTYDPELDKKLSPKEKLMGKPHFQQFGHRAEDNVAPPDPRLANPSYRQGIMGKGKAKYRPEPYNLKVWASDENDMVEVVEAPATAHVEEQHAPEDVQKIGQQLQLTPVVQKGDVQAVERTEEQVAETAEAQATPEIMEKAEEQPAATVVEKDEVQSAAEVAQEFEAQFTSKATPAPASQSSPAATALPAATGGFFSSLLKAMPKASGETSNAQSSTDGASQQLDHGAVSRTGVNSNTHESAIARAERPGKAPPMSSAIHAAYQSLD